MADVDLDALEHQVRVANGEVPNICRTFRETAAWGVIPRVPALIAELRRLRGQTAMLRERVAEMPDCNAFGSASGPMVKCAVLALLEDCAHAPKEGA